MTADAKQPEEPDESKIYTWPVIYWGTTTNPSPMSVTYTYPQTVYTTGSPGMTGAVGLPLFGEWILRTRELQEQFYGKNFDNFTQEELVEWVRINILAAEDELHEALGEISWKPWAKSEYFHREAFIGEVVDVLHFVANLLAGANVSDQELNAAYLEKMERNRERQRSNYTGLDKCSKCGRAADDVKAHGGYMKEWDGTQETYDRSIPVEERYVNEAMKGYGCNRCFGVDGDEYK